MLNEIYVNIQHNQVNNNMICSACEIIGVNQQKSDRHVKSDKCLFQTFWRLSSEQKYPKKIYVTCSNLFPRKIITCLSLPVCLTFADSPLMVRVNVSMLHVLMT